jgi:hypothetical protein
MPSDSGVGCSSLITPHRDHDGAQSVKNASE